MRVVVASLAFVFCPRWDMPSLGDKAARKLLHGLCGYDDRGAITIGGGAGILVHALSRDAE